MTGLPETTAWAETVYQLETTDPVMGGPDGVDNLPHKQLAARTQYLKARVEALLAEVEALQTDAATADATAASETVAGHAKIAPQAAVDAGIDDTMIVSPLKLARRLAAWVAGSATKWATARKITLSGAVTGAVSLDGSADVSLVTTVATVTPATDAAYADDSVQPASTAWVRRAMAAIAGAAGCAWDMASPGYLRFPSWLGGLMVQWGSLTAATSTTGEISGTYYATPWATFRTAFPNAAFAAFASADGGAGGLNWAAATTPTKTGMTVYLYNSTSGGSMAAFWLAIGY